MDGYAIMPDHLHLVLKLHEAVPLSELVESFRKFTARRANRVLQRAGALWQRAFYDHAIRDQMDYETRMRYMWENPVRAGLAQRAEEYAWCSVHGLPDAPLPAGEQ